MVLLLLALLTFV